MSDIFSNNGSTLVTLNGPYLWTNVSIILLLYLLLIFLSLGILRILYIQKERQSARRILLIHFLTSELLLSLSLSSMIIIQTITWPQYQSGRIAFAVLVVSTLMCKFVSDASVVALFVECYMFICKALYYDANIAKTISLAFIPTSWIVFLILCTSSLIHMLGAPIFHSPCPFIPYVFHMPDNYTHDVISGVITLLCLLVVLYTSIATCQVHYGHIQEDLRIAQISERFSSTGRALRSISQQVMFGLPGQMNSNLGRISEMSDHSKNISARSSQNSTTPIISNDGRRSSGLTVRISKTSRTDDTTKQIDQTNISHCDISTNEPQISLKYECEITHHKNENNDYSFHKPPPLQLCVSRLSNGLPSSSTSNVSDTISTISSFVRRNHDDDISGFMPMPRIEVISPSSNGQGSSHGSIQDLSEAISSCDSRTSVDISQEISQRDDSFTDSFTAHISTPDLSQQISICSIDSISTTQPSPYPREDCLPEKFSLTSDHMFNFQSNTASSISLNQKDCLSNSFTDISVKSMGTTPTELNIKSEIDGTVWTTQMTTKVGGTSNELPGQVFATDFTPSVSSKSQLGQKLSPINKDNNLRKFNQQKRGGKPNNKEVLKLRNVHYTSTLKSQHDGLQEKNPDNISEPLNTEEKKTSMLSTTDTSSVKLSVRNSVGKMSMIDFLIDDSAEQDDKEETLQDVKVKNEPTNTNGVSRIKKRISVIGRNRKCATIFWTSVRIFLFTVKRVPMLVFGSPYIFSGQMLEKAHVAITYFTLLGSFFEMLIFVFSECDLRREILKFYFKHRPTVVPVDTFSLNSS